MKNNISKYFSKIIFFILTIFCIILLSISPITVGLISGQSMYPTFKNNTIYLGTSKIQSINRDDIIVAYSDKLKECVIKRVIGLPGEKLTIKNNKIYINDLYIEDEDGNNLIKDNSINYPIILGKDEYFVLGDNRNNSIDSRSIGAIKKDNIKAKIIYGVKKDDY